MVERPRKLFSMADAQAVIRGLVRAGDGLIVALAGVVAYWLRVPELGLPGLYLAAIAAGVLLTVNYMHLARHFRAKLSGRRDGLSHRASL